MWRYLSSAYTSILADDATIAPVLSRCLRWGIPCAWPAHVKSGLAFVHTTTSAAPNTLSTVARIFCVASGRSGWRHLCCCCVCSSDRRLSHRLSLTHGVVTAAAGLQAALRRAARWLSAPRRRPSRAVHLRVAHLPSPWTAVKAHSVAPHCNRGLHRLRTSRCSGHLA